MNARHVVILGGTGFVGRQLAERLLEDGARVVVPSRAGGRPERPGLPTGAELRRGDVYDPDFLADAFAGADAVVNLAGILNERGDDGSGFERVFVGLAERMLAAMQAAGVRRLLQMSALHAAPDAPSHYLQARGRAEALVRASGLDWTIFRPSVIAGPGDGLFCRFAGLLRYTPALPIARANACFQPVWVEDVAEALVRALDQPETVGQGYDLVGPERYTLRRIVEMTAEASGHNRLVLALPGVLGRLQAEVGELLPGKPISRDNWRSLQLDSVSDDNGLPKLGIAPTPVAPRLPEILGLE